jgi:sec-independent protein translocase protein TatA
MLYNLKKLNEGFIMSFGFTEIILVVLIGVLLFGRGRISDLMGDVAKGIKSFKKAMSEEEVAANTKQSEEETVKEEPQKAIEYQPAEPTSPTRRRTTTKKDA